MKPPQRRIVPTFRAAALGSALGLTLAGCGGEWNLHFPIGKVVTCDALMAEEWSVRTHTEVPAGESRTIALEYHRGAHPLDVCADRVRDLSWSVSEPAVASVTPAAVAAHRYAWVTGLRPGRTLVAARISFVDGTEKLARPSEVPILPPAGPPGDRLVASGTRAFANVNSSCSAPASSCHTHPLTLTEAGRVDIVVDWQSPLNNVGALLFPGHCTEWFACGASVTAGLHGGSKPARDMRKRVAAGPYTLWVWNSGPAPEVVRYEVWLTPRP